MNTSIRMAEVKKTVIASNAGKDTEKLDYPYTAGGNVKWYSGNFKKLNMHLPYDPAITHVGFYPRVMKMYIHTKTCIHMFREDLFVKPQIGNNPNIYNI